MKKQPTLSILDFHKLFPDNDTCLDYLFEKHHAQKKCPECGDAGKYHHAKGTSKYICQCGGSQISPKAGTIFEKSDTDLVKWFFAIFLMSQSRNGVAAKKIERACQVTYKTAWRMARQIRLLMQEHPELLSGEIEADETMVGGKRHGSRGWAAEGKTIVFGTVQRKGRVQTSGIKDFKADTLLPYFKDNVAKGSDLITGKMKSYKTIGVPSLRCASYAAFRAASRLTQVALNGVGTRRSSPRGSSRPCSRDPRSFLLPARRGRRPGRRQRR